MEDDDQRLQVSFVLAEVNGHVRDLGEQFEASDGAEGAFAFMCECGVAGCEEKVLLSLAEFDAFQQSEGVVLAAGHELTRAQLARRTALRLRDEARRSEQKQHQRKRTRRIASDRDVP